MVVLGAKEVNILKFKSGILPLSFQLIDMATFEIKTKHSMNVKGEYIDRGLSVRISSMFANPLDEKEKVHKAFMRVHGLDLKTEGYLNTGYLEFHNI